MWKRKREREKASLAEVRQVPVFVVMLIVVIELLVKNDLSDDHRLSRLQLVNTSSVCLFLKQSIFMNIQALAIPG
jgi:hypothetical protein